MPPVIKLSATSAHYARFAEKVNGRSAMQGVAWAVVNPIHRFDSLEAVAVTALVAAGTAITFDTQKQLQWGPFTEEAEQTNGRGAMLAMAAYLTLKHTGTI